MKLDILSNDNNEDFENDIHESNFRTARNYQKTKSNYKIMNNYDTQDNINNNININNFNNNSNEHKIKNMVFESQKIEQQQIQEEKKNNQQNNKNNTKLNTVDKYGTNFNFNSNNYNYTSDYYSDIKKYQERRKSQKKGPEFKKIYEPRHNSLDKKNSDAVDRVSIPFLLESLKSQKNKQPNNTNSQKSAGENYMVTNFSGNRGLHEYESETEQKKYDITTKNQITDEQNIKPETIITIPVRQISTKNLSDSNYKIIPSKEIYNKLNRINSDSSQQSPKVLEMRNINLLKTSPDKRYLSQKKKAEEINKDKVRISTNKKNARGIPVPISSNNKEKIFSSRNRKNHQNLNDPSPRKQLMESNDFNNSKGASVFSSKFPSKNTSQAKSFLA